MLVPNTYLLLEESRARRENLLREAERERLGQLRRLRHGHWARRLRQQVGDWLIGLGHRLTPEPLPRRGLPTV